MEISSEIANECFETVATHYADKIRKGCDGITEEQVRDAVSLNWGTISKEVADLYATVVVLLEETEVQF